MQKVIGEILFDDIALVAQADDEIVDAMGCVHLHDVPQDGAPADLNHGLGPQVRLFRNAGAQTTGQDDGFHNFI